jgi:hypothetical protein
MEIRRVTVGANQMEESYRQEVGGAKPEGA